MMHQNIRGFSQLPSPGCTLHSGPIPDRVNVNKIYRFYSRYFGNTPVIRKQYTFFCHILLPAATFVNTHGSLGAMKKKTCYALNNFIVQSDKESGRMPTVYVVTNPMFWFFKFKFNMEKLTCQR